MTSLVVLSSDWGPHCTVLTPRSITKSLILIGMLGKPVVVTLRTRSGPGTARCYRWCEMYRSSKSPSIWSDFCGTWGRSTVLFGSRALQAIAKLNEDGKLRCGTNNDLILPQAVVFPASNDHDLAEPILVHWSRFVCSKLLKVFIDGLFVAWHRTFQVFQLSLQILDSWILRKSLRLVKWTPFEKFVGTADLFIPRESLTVQWSVRSQVGNATDLQGLEDDGLLDNILKRPLLRDRGLIGTYRDLVHSRPRCAVEFPPLWPVRWGRVCPSCGSSSTMAAQS